jgi:uncharacterized protein (TIGR00661 family)
VPLIKQLLVDNAVILGVTPTTALIFNEEFPELKKVDVEPYDIRYSHSLPLSVKLLFDAPRIFEVIKKERLQLKHIIQEHHIDIVISDNRFGLHDKSADCIYITHQLSIQAGIFSWIVDKIHHHFIKQFNSIWIPDFEDEHRNLSGKLSKNPSLQNVRYIGPLSRLSVLGKTENQIDYLCLLSGPEPLRTYLEKVLMEKANRSDKRIYFVRGTVKKAKSFANKNLVIIDMPDAKQLSQLIADAKIVVCRSGYSTLMDLHHLQKTNCILVPTPGQEEQEYLAKYWEQKFAAKVIQQKELNNFSFK